jgi:hypothetical protein
VCQGSNQVPLVSKYHHPIISFGANHTANTLSCLPLTFEISNLFQEFLLEKYLNIRGDNQKELFFFLKVIMLLPKHQMLGSHPPLSGKFPGGTPT